MKKYLPRTSAKMAVREADAEVHVTVLGDGVSNYFQPEVEDRYATQNVWWRIFLNKLASNYFFTGGVREANASRLQRLRTKTAQALHLREEEDDAPRPAPPLAEFTSGPSIAVTNLARDGATVVQALQSLTTEAFDNDPDLILIMYGTDDAPAGTSLKTYRQTLEEAVKICRLHQADLILAAPPLIAGKDSRLMLAATRPYAVAAREVATAAGILFLDAGAGQAECELGPDGPERADCFDHAVAHILEQYEHGSVEDYYHPNALGHRRIGEAAWRSLLSGPNTETLGVTGSFTLPSKPNDPAVLEITVRNPSEEKVGAIATGCLAVDRRWMPKQALSEPEANQELSAADALSSLAKGRTLRIPCELLPSAGPALGPRLDLGFGEEEIMRTSLFLSSGERTRLVDVILSVVPLVVTFPVGRLEAQSNELVVEASVRATSANPFSGSAELIWRGQSQNFDLSIPSGQKQSMRLRLPLPKSTDQRYLKSLLTLNFKDASGQYTFSREIEATRNLRLDEPTPLMMRGQALADAKPESWQPSADSPGITFKAEENGLYLIFDLPPADPNRSKTQPSARIDVSIDARGPNNRGRLGFCDQAQLDIPWEDGRLSVGHLRPALFGDGYDRELDPRFFLASLTTQPSGRRQVRLSIPRNYFYLHQWSLRDAGQNTLGVNTQVNLLETSPQHPDGIFVFEKTYGLINNGLHRHDPQSLAVLELSSGPSVKWSARIY